MWPFCWFAQKVQISAPEGITHPATAAPRVIVGYLMMRLVQAIDWNDAEVAFPAFLMIAGIPLTVSIAAGIGFGIMGHAVVKVARGKPHEISILMWVLVPRFLAFYASGWLERHVF